VFEIVQLRCIRQRNKPADTSAKIGLHIRIGVLLYQGACRTVPYDAAQGQRQSVVSFSVGGTADPAIAVPADTENGDDNLGAASDGLSIYPSGTRTGCLTGLVGEGGAPIRTKRAPMDPQRTAPRPCHIASCDIILKNANSHGPGTLCPGPPRRDH
jgi:hypothetical protein